MIKNVQNGCAEDGSMIELSETRRNGKKKFNIILELCEEQLCNNILLKLLI